MLVILTLFLLCVLLVPALTLLVSKLFVLGLLVLPVLVLIAYVMRWRSLSPQ